MRIKRKIQILTASYQALAVIFLAPLASLANESTPTGLSGSKLDNFEQVIYGAPRKNLSTEARLKALEIKLFGASKTGTYDNRLAAIQKSLAYGRGTATSPDFLPPLAPTLDTASESTNTSSAPRYSSKDESFDAGSDKGSGLPDSTKAVADAMQLYTNGKPDQAEQAFRKIIANDPNNSDAYYNLGVIAEGRGDLKAALNDYKQAQRINPQDQDLRDTVTAVGNKLEASQRTIASNNSGSNNVSGNASGSGAPPRAPGRGHAGNGAGSSSAGGSGEADRARLKGMVDDASAKYKHGDYDGAIGELGQVSNEAPGDPDVQFAMGQAYKAKGDLGRARTAMARAAALDPNNTSYQDALASLTGAAAGNVANASGGTGITPFAGSHAQSSGGGLSGFTSHAGSTMGRRLTRAVEFGIAGAAVGGLTGALFRGGGGYRGGYGGGYGGYGGYGYGRSTGYSSMRSGALRGAVTGSLLGLIFGR